MDAKQVTEKILSEAQAEADKIKKQADENVSRIQSELQKQLENFDRETESLAANAARDKKARILAAARMEIAKQNLAARRELLDRVFAAAVEKITKLGDDEYLGWMEKLIASAAVTGDEEIIIGSSETRIDNKFVNDVNNRLSGNREGNLRLAQDRADIQAGFIIRRGRIKTNVSVETLAAMTREKIEGQIAGEIFG